MRIGNSYKLIRVCNGIKKHKQAAVYLHSCQEFHPPLRSCFTDGYIHIYYLYESAGEWNERDGWSLQAEERSDREREIERVRAERRKKTSVERKRDGRGAYGLGGLSGIETLQGDRGAYRVRMDKGRSLGAKIPRRD